MNYMEDNAALSYKLVSLDGNYFRNARFLLIWIGKKIIIYVDS
jgi:hypothetical protein